MTKKITLQLDALTCPSCLTKIEGALKQQAGISNIKVLFNASKVKAEFDDGQITPDEIKAVVTKLGYEVLKMKVKEPAVA
ncbi:heavy-metal-associated domain-containing protein [Lacticaseibacillus sp. GG6-2]